MATDRQLSRDFWLHEFTGWQQASETEVEELRRFVGELLQPIRRRWGVITPTSWRRWSAGQLRDGPHALGAVDFVPREASIDDVHEWAGTYLPASFGQLIHERDHLHATPPGTPVKGRPRYGEVWIEPTEGTYVFGGALPLAPALGLVLFVLATVALAMIRQ